LAHVPHSHLLTLINHSLMTIAAWLRSALSNEYVPRCDSQEEEVVVAAVVVEGGAEGSIRRSGLMARATTEAQWVEVGSSRR
jgi:hypothetical protein